MSDNPFKRKLDPTQFDRTKEIAKFLEALPPHTRDTVCWRCDPRHLGKIVASYPNGTGSVEWESGYRSECVPLSQLKRTDGE